MSSLVPPPLHPKVIKSMTQDNEGKTKSGRKKVATRSARRIKNGSEDVTHVVKVTVLGLAGITVDRSKCRTQKSVKSSLPAPPSKMRAVVAFSRNSAIRGTTILSKPLTRSPNDDVVVAATEGDEDLSGTAGDETATYTTKSSGLARPRRHVAVWASDDMTLGSTVTFEANLHRSDNAGGVKRTAASSAFAPKSFDLTIALTEGDNDDQAAVALPFGVSTLAISGEECDNGKSITVDLPVLSLSQARPLGAASGMGGYPIITLAPRQKAANVAETTFPDEPLKKKRTGLQRLFSKKDKMGADENGFPSIVERDAFVEAYSVDSGGDAILRVCLEVHEKSNQRAKRRASNAEVNAVATTTSPARHPRLDERPEILAIHPDDSTANDTTDGDKSGDEDAESATVDSNYSDDGSDYSGSDAEYSGEGSELTGSLLTADDETITLDGSMVTTEDNRIAFFSWVNRPTPTITKSFGEDSYSLSFEKKDKKKVERRSLPFSVQQEEHGKVSVSVFGRQITLPSCGALTVDDDDVSLNDDLTHVTADFLGKSYRIPVCAGIATKEYGDDDTLTTYAEGNVPDGRSRSKIANVVDSYLCQSRGMEDDISIANTLSTLSDHPDDTKKRKKKKKPKDAPAQSDAVDHQTKSEGLLNAGSMPADENMIAQNSRLSKDAKVPVSNDFIEVDDIMRVVRSQHLSRSPNGRVSHISKVNAVPSQEQHTSTTDQSPKGVADYTADEHRYIAGGSAQGTNATNPKEQIVKNISEIFQCQYAPLHDDEDDPPYEPTDAQIPPVIIHSEADVLSVGDLTATTHEQNIASEAHLLERARKIFQDKIPTPEKTQRHARELSPVPIACGGDVFCRPLVTRNTTSTPIRVTASKDSSSIVEGHRSHDSRENYFARLDEITGYSPIEVVKVASTEKESTSFSRVRSPPSSERAIQGQSLYSESLPVYNSMGGDESIIGTITETRGKHFDPLTGQEVDQGFF